MNVTHLTCLNTQRATRVLLVYMLLGFSHFKQCNPMGLHIERNAVRERVHTHAEGGKLKCTGICGK